MSKARKNDRPPSRLMQQMSIETEVHLRRMYVKEALEKLDRYLSDAAIAGLPRVRVIHGKSGGVLKAAVHEFLDNHALIARRYAAAPSEGNGGVTIAELK